MRRTKIVATLGPASDSDASIRRLIEAGVDVMRLNFSHGTHEEHAERITRIRAQSEAVGKPVAILQDLQGPKIRTGPLKNDMPVLLQDGASFTITTEQIEGDARRVSTTYQDLPRDVQPRDRILLSDGLIELLVTAVRDQDVVTQVVQGGSLREHQGINLPGTAVSTSAITDKDREDLEFGLAHGVDFVAMSFVRRAADVQQLKDLIAAHGANTPVVAKIEKPQALDDLDAILEVTDVVMVARGDLGVEMPPEQVPLAQKTIIQAASTHNVMVITATQMLESMIHHPRPTRAEASDVANAIFDGTDAVMLSGETAVGEFAVEAVQMMHRIAVTTEESARYREQSDVLHRAHHVSKHADSSQAISHAARTIARTLDVRAIVAFTQSGYTARLVSKDRPRVPIFALTPEQHVARRLSLYWGVKPFICPPIDRLDDLTNYMQNMLKEHECVESGDRIVMTGGHPLPARGATNFIKIVDIP
ncbi:MAG TPA: pyruvate kinase [Herpetosiphonaceae bacterium]